MSKKKVSTKRVIAAIPVTGGIISEIARRCRVNRNTIANYAKDNPEIQAAIEQKTDAFCDVAESSLLTLVREKNVSAVIFYLKTKGRHRGYTERMEVQAAKPVSIAISPEEANYFDDEISLIHLSVPFLMPMSLAWPTNDFEHEPSLSRRMGCIQTAQGGVRH